MIPTNLLYYGDNLEFLRNREYFPDESVDLIYLDPPFNSAQSYNVLYKEADGTPSTAQVKAFDDTWQWDESAARALHELNTQVRHAPRPLLGLVNSLQEFLGHSPMFAYLVQMAVRLVELHRVLKPTGSLFLHCDPTASHFLKLVLDGVFGKRNFRNEIVWHYTGWNKRLRSRLESRHDVILFYCKRQPFVFNYPTEPWESKEQYLRIRKQKLHRDRQGREYVMSDAGGGKRVKRFIEEAIQYGRPLDDVFDIDKLTSGEKEALGYDTQKPVKLLKRLIETGSNPGSIIFDPFCGCGTTIDAVESLNHEHPKSHSRLWIGIDVTHLAIDLIKFRLATRFGITRKEYEVIGEPTTIEESRALALENRHQFQYWALGLIEAKPWGDEKKKGRDRGIDGWRPFIHGVERSHQKCLVQVKSGKVTSAHIRDLKGTMEREKAELAAFITLEPATAEMRTEAAAAGFYHSEVMNRDYPRLQILTIEELLSRPECFLFPPGGEFQPAPRFVPRKDQQNQMFK